MSIPLFLAITPAEFAHLPELPNPLAWMSVRLSLTSPGLSNVPSQLPPGSLIIFDDKTPWSGHSVELVCKEMTTLLLNTKAYGLLLDFERAPTPETILLVKALSQCCKEIGIPLAAPEGYGGDESVAVFTSPFPCWKKPTETSNDHRALWLDASPTAHALRITQDHAVGIALPYPPETPPEEDQIHWDESLHCAYWTDFDGDGLVITMYRTPEKTTELLAELPSSPFRLAVGVWREYALSELP